MGFVDGNAVEWSGPSNSLTVTTLGSGYALATDGVEASGYSSAVQPRAWSLSPLSQSDLTPSPLPTYPGGLYFGPGTYLNSYATGVWDNRESGVVLFNSAAQHACYWNDSANSFVDLSPDPNYSSMAHGVGFDGSLNETEVGYGQFTAIAGGAPHAVAWHDTAASVIDLNPTGATQSEAFGISYGNVVGDANLPGGQHAILWHGLGGSYTDLDPGAAGELSSVAYAVSTTPSGSEQAGSTYFGGSLAHASYWDGSAATWVDLQSYLPAGFSESAASGVWTSPQGVTYVTGYALDGNGNDEAMLWVHTADVPEPCAGLLSIAGLSCLCRFHRRRQG